MKRWWVYLIILVVIAIAFSIGYYQSKHIKTKIGPLPMNIPGAITTETNSSIPGKTIVFTYQLQTTLSALLIFTTHEKDSNELIKGNGYLKEFIEIVYPKQEPLEIFTISSIFNQPYYFYLRYPTGETKEKLWKLVSNVLSFQSIDMVSTLRYYEMTQNGQPLKFKKIDANANNGQGWETNKDNTLFTFTGDLASCIRSYLLFYRLPGR